MAPSPRECTEKLVLRESLLQAIAEVNRLQVAKTSAVIGGLEFLLDSELDTAREFRDRARDALVAHIQSHHCACQW
jgi:hypothetical protein